MIGYVRKSGGNTTMFFKINDSKFLKKYNQIIHKDKNKNIWWQHNTNFQGKKMPKEKVPCKYLSIIVLHSVVKAKKNYYPTNIFGRMQI